MSAEATEQRVEWLEDRLREWMGREEGQETFEKLARLRDLAETTEQQRLRDAGH